MSTEFLGQSWNVWGFVALGIAALFAVFVPMRRRVQAISGLQFIIVRWFHSLVWVLLAISFFLRAGQNETAAAIADPVAAVGGFIYLIYIITMQRLPNAS